jgi:hypothetical protein
MPNWKFPKKGELPPPQNAKPQIMFWGWYFPGQVGTYEKLLFGFGYYHNDAFWDMSYEDEDGAPSEMPYVYCWAPIPLAPQNPGG